MAEKHNVDLPLTNAVCEICYGGNITDYRQACLNLLSRLMARDAKTEFYQ